MVSAPNFSKKVGNCSPQAFVNKFMWFSIKKATQLLAKASITPHTKKVKLKLGSSCKQKFTEGSEQRKRLPIQHAFPVAPLGGRVLCLKLPYVTLPDQYRTIYSFQDA